MPKKIRHQTQWFSNKNILAELVSDNRYPDWIAIVAFYTALHRIEQVLAQHNEHPKGHSDRRRILSQTKFENLLSEQVILDYFDMYDVSRSARYYCQVPSPKDVQEQLDRLARIDAKVASIP